MASTARALLMLVALGVGCATQTIDLLAPPEGAGTGGSSGSPGAAGHYGGSAARGGSSTLAGGAGNVASGGEGGSEQGGAGSDHCVLDLDCPTSRPHCVAIPGTSNYHCVECAAQDDCDTGQRCNFLTSECAPACTTFEQCPLTLPFCERGVCIQCQTDSHCGPNVCVFGRCKECRSMFECPESAPVCGESYTCRPCTGMFQCGQYRYCDLMTGHCEPF